MKLRKAERQPSFRSVHRRSDEQHQHQRYQREQQYERHIFSPDMIIEVTTTAEGNRSDHNIDHVSFQEKVRRIEFRLGYYEARTEHIDCPEDQQHDHDYDDCFQIIRPEFFAITVGGRIIFYYVRSCGIAQPITSQRLKFIGCRDKLQQKISAISL